jgi:formylglycine-generating enzyme
VCLALRPSFRPTSTSAHGLRSFVLLAALACAACVDPHEHEPSRSDPFGLMPGSPAGAKNRGRGQLSRFLPRAPAAPPRVASSAKPQVSLPPEVDAPTPEPPHPDPTDDEAACPREMVVVHGDFCPNVRQDCAKWLDQYSAGAPKTRCAEFVKPSTCVGERHHVRYCIDRLEYARAPGELPVTDVSWTVARDLCESMDKRLCTENEWIFACEGPEMLPYPHGFERGSGVCNFDRSDLVLKGKMVDHRKPVTDFPGCVSPFGVANMVGNADEWVWLEHGYPPQRSGLKGGWWLAGRNRCRPVTGGHDEYFHEVQTGFRCCKDALAEPS